jgi:hypothetical protein
MNVWTGVLRPRVQYSAFTAVSPSNTGIQRHPTLIRRAAMNPDGVIGIV